ncbi:MAG: hypothetical protein UW85_C0012G0018 [Parcubacteria group bacterium GW2011_GWA1_Parcubacteria_45_10]|nr:MAG: hypothetical protein UW85_C0012G0018 [Parcubacteria group bacterium GW2011_GWA1_Parcubacteria_45_10]
MRFYLGTHQTDWLGKTEVPLFVSRRRLALRKKLPRAAGRWALDSGGFSELSMHGRWQTSAAQYVAEVRRFSAEVGNLDWAAIQDWMCEPHMLKLTGKTIAEHQALTIASYHELRSLAPEIPWAPVLQGWRRADYLSCFEQYARGGGRPSRCVDRGARQRVQEAGDERGGGLHPRARRRGAAAAWVRLQDARAAPGRRRARLERLPGVELPREETPSAPGLRAPLLRQLPALRAAVARRPAGPPRRAGGGEATTSAVLIGPGPEGEVRWRSW